MIKYLYSVRDRLSGQWTDPFLSFNDNSAIRDFKLSINQPNILYQKTDLELYFLGEFNITTGELVADNKPKFICGGEGVE